MKAVFVTLVLAASLANAALTTFTSLPAWQAATAPGPYGIEDYTDLTSDLTLSGAAPHSISAGNLHVYLAFGTLTFSLADGGTFDSLIMHIDTLPASQGSGVYGKADGTGFGSVGTTAIYQGWFGFTSTQAVTQVTLYTLFNAGNFTFGEHLDVDEVRWVETPTVTIETHDGGNVPEPGSVGMAVLGLGLVLAGKRWGKR